ncbi:MAG: HNH endonuclease [Promethearchaeota archaeon]|nr:MAG: HNH endonuclease [Candidatus Lokiarchaeota archaeon]
MKSIKIKICNSCHRVLGEDSFYWVNKKKDMRRPYCKRCVKNQKVLWAEDNPNYNKEWHKNHPDYRKQWYKDNSESQKQYAKQFHIDNPEYSKLYYINNKKYRQEYSKQYRTDNKEHIKQYQILYDKQYYINNKEHRREYFKQWQQNNPDKCNANNAKRRAMKLNQTPNLTELEQKKINLYYKISDYMGPEWSVDHIIPINKDGLHHPDNLQVTTVEENSRKRDRLDYTIPEELTIRI